MADAAQDVPRIEDAPAAEAAPEAPAEAPKEGITIFFVFFYSMVTCGRWGAVCGSAAIANARGRHEHESCTNGARGGGAAARAPGGQGFAAFPLGQGEEVGRLAKHPDNCIVRVLVDKSCVGVTFVCGFA